MGFLGAWTPEKSEISLSTHHSNLNMEPEGAYTTRNPSSYPYHSPGCCHSAGRHYILPGNCWFTTGQRICCLMSKQCVPHGNSHPIIDLDASNHINQWHFFSMDDLNILKWWHVSLVSSKNIIYPEASHTECVFPFSILLPILSLSSGRVPSFEGSGSWKQPGLPRIVGVGLRKGAPWPFVAKRVGGGGGGKKAHGTSTL